MTQVREIMERDVTAISPRAPVSDLIQMLDGRGISGVPVVDQQEKLVGVVSQTDVIRLMRQLSSLPDDLRWGLEGTPSGPGSVTTPEPQGEFFAYYVTRTGGFVDVRDQIRSLPTDLFEGYRVEDIMTPAPFVIEAEAPLEELARLLLDKEVHRALIVDGGKLVGLATTGDVLRAVARG